MEQINHHDDDEHDQSSNEENTHDDQQQLLFKYLAESLQKQQQIRPIDFSTNSHLNRKTIQDDQDDEVEHEEENDDDDDEDVDTVKRNHFHRNKLNSSFIFSTINNLFL